MKRLIHTSRATYVAKDILSGLWIVVYEKKRWWIFPYLKKIGEVYRGSISTAVDLIAEHEERQTQQALLRNATHE